MLIPQQLITGSWYQWSGTAHMKKEATHFPKTGFFNPVFVVFIPCTTLMNQKAIPFKWRIIWVKG
jgi:hypothetical protein